MKRLLWLVVVLSLCVETRTAIGSAWDDMYPDPPTFEGEDGAGPGVWRGDHVIQSLDEMTAALKKYNDTGLFLEFFLPWCGHSRRLRPEFRRASTMLAGKPFFARVDCSSPGGARVCLQFDVQYHPHMLLAMGGKSYEYTLRATAAEIVRYCHRLLGAHVTSIFALGELIELLEEEQVIVAAVVEEDEDVPGFFIDTARMLKDQLRFISLSAPVFAEALALPRPGPTLLVLRLKQESRIWKQDDAAPADSRVALSSKFVEWVTQQQGKLVESLTQENFQEHFGAGIPVLLLFHDDSPASASAMRAMYSTAEQQRGFLKVCHVNGARYQKLAVKLGVRPRVLPAVVIVDVDKQAQYVYPEHLPITSDHVAAFTARVLSGQEPPTLRSAEAPLIEEGPVYTLVADRFRKVAMDPSKDVLVNFHTRWCGFCNLFAPTYKELALTLSHVETIVFYDFDCSLNDPDPKLNITHFPTLMLFSAHNKTALPYFGDRSVALISRFMAEHVGHKIEILPDGVSTDRDTAQRIHTAIDAVKKSISHR